jgi:hypothetical protein
VGDGWRSTRVALAAVLLVAAWPAARAQCDTSAGRPIDIAGQVIDARALVPLRASLVLTAGRDTIATLETDSTGFFSAIICRRSSVMAHFRRPGYRADSLPVAFDSTRWMPLDVAMSPLRDPAGVTLATARATAPRTLSAVEARVRRAGGIYIGGEEIDRLQPHRVSDLLRGRRGVTLEGVDGSLRPTSASCTMRIGVNGHLMPEDYRLDEVAVADIVAIEIYGNTASTPVEFSVTRRAMACGLAMIWLRGGMGLP